MSEKVGDNDRALVTLIPRTTSTRQTRFEAPVNVPFLKPGAFDAQGIVTIPVGHAIRMLGKLNAELLGGVEKVVCLWLGLPCTDRE
jgi:mRNA interferase MazF